MQQRCSYGTPGHNFLSFFFGLFFWFCGITAVLWKISFLVIVWLCQFFSPKNMGASTELNFSFCLPNFYFFQRKNLAKLSDMWITFWVYNGLKEVSCLGVERGVGEDGKISVGKRFLRLPRGDIGGCSLSLLLQQWLIWYGWPLGILSDHFLCCLIQ